MPLLIRALCLGSVETNCYVVGCADSREGFVIDPSDEAPRILAVVAELRLRVLAVLVTHAHFDHIMAASAVAAGTRAPLALHRQELMPYREGGGASLFGLPQPELPEPGLWLAQGDRLAFGSYAFEVLFTPGHSPGHVSFYERGAGVVFSGDVLFAGGIGRTDLPGADHETLLESIAGRLATLPGATRVFPGHGPATTIEAELAGNPWLNG